MVEMEQPIPKDDEVLIRTRAASVMAGDCELRGSKGSVAWQFILRMGFGFRAPRRKVLGQDLAGEIESVGRSVARFKKGDQIFANSGLRLGAYAEYCCLPEKGLIALKPSNATFEEAVTFPSAALYVMPLLRRASLGKDQRVMIIGAAGTMGTLAVQLCKQSGAEVTGVDRNGKLNLVRSIGADDAIDYTKRNPTDGGSTYDLIFDTVGRSSFAGSVKSLKENGTYIMGNLGLLRAIRGRVASMKGGRRVVAGFASYTAKDLTLLKEMIEAKKIRPVIDRRYPLEQIVEAHSYVDSGQKAGNVVISV
jgi:NADPH:quinone reductase-like Zn-dependent oxidoreductase